MRCARAALGLAAVLAAVAAAPAAAQAAVAPAPARTLDFLRVGPPGGPAGLPQIVDGAGRTTLLKGVNVDGIVDYWRGDLADSYPTDPSAYAAGACPADDPTVEGVRVCDFDFAQMRALGFDAIRLNLSWSLLEPSPGEISQLYLDRIAQIVGWAKQEGIYVVLDMHQDAWSKYIYTPPGQGCPAPLQATRGYDGAPLWASAHVSPVCALEGVRELDSAVAEDFQRLYSDLPAPDGVGLQEHYAAALTALARRFAGEPAVAGYEVINEPSPGFDAAPGVMDVSELFPFYGRMVDAVVRAVPRFRQLFFLEPNAERNLTDQPQALAPWSSFSRYRNVVYAPHIYTGVFTLDQEVTSHRFFPSETGYRSAITDAHNLGTPLWVGEFGNNPADDQTLLRTSYALQDKYGLGGTLWLWKENANDVNGAVFWGVYGRPFGPGVPQLARLAIVDRAYPLSLAGTLESLRYDDVHATVDLHASAPAVPAGDTQHATVLFLPQNDGGIVRTQNATVQVFERSPGVREAYVYPRGGRYRVYTTPAPSAAPVAPDSSACISRRTLRLALLRGRGVSVRSVLVRVHGRPVAARVTRAGARLVLVVRGTRRMRASVTIILRVRRGARGATRRLVLHRHYSPCTPGGHSHARR